ncbi:MAG: CaiB/BaiF CoA transferase family protein [Dehalococcoidia bacterium]
MGSHSQPQDIGGLEQQPLTGYRVLDLSGPMGVYCGKLLADMGADVIKVEPPGGDPMRRVGPFLHDRVHYEHSLHWLHFNANKRSITLDVATADGAELLCKIAHGADVLLETFPPGYLSSLGLGYGRLEAENSGLIYASLTPFGQTGPYKDFMASDLIGLAMGGYLYVTGWPHTPPTRLWGSQAYHTTSNRAFIAILLALYHRLATGQGQYVDVSMQEAVAAATEHVNTAYNYEGIPAVRCGFRHGGQFVATWRCKDGYVSITTNTQQAWDDLRAWMARDGMAGDLMDEKFNDRFILRGDLSGHIEQLVQDWALLHTRQEITDWGQSHHHPWGPVAIPEELLKNEQLWERGYFIEIEDPENAAAMIYPGAPYKLSRSPWKLRHTAPQVGQHNIEVYCGDLGLSAADLEALAGAGAI